MNNMDYLKNMPTIVIGSGEVGMTIAADCEIAGQEVRIYESSSFAQKSLFNVENTGVEIDGDQRNLYNFK